MRSYVAILIYMASITLAATAKGQNDDQPTVTLVFEHPSGGRVIEISIFDDEDSEWIHQGYYWAAPGDSNFYKIAETGHGKELDTEPASTRTIKTRRLLSFFAPKPGQPTYIAVFEIDYRFERASESSPARETGQLKLVCHDGQTCFALAADKTAQINDKLQKGTITLHGIPEFRAVTYILKFPQEDRYILIDWLPTTKRLKSAEVLAGTPHNMTFMDVTKIDYPVEGGVVSVHLEDGTMISIPPDRKAKATYDSLFRDPEPLEQLSVTWELIENLGLPASRYSIPILRTPCELLRHGSSGRRS